MIVKTLNNDGRKGAAFPIMDIHPLFRTPFSQYQLDAEKKAAIEDDAVPRLSQPLGE